MKKVIIAITALVLLPLLAATAHAQEPDLPLKPTLGGTNRANGTYP